MARNMPVFFTRGQLVRTLREMADRVEVGDSFEGNIEYTMPWSEEIGDPETDHADGFRVRAAYRVGNLQGQGGMRMIGEIR